MVRVRACLCFESAFVCALEVRVRVSVLMVRVSALVWVWVVWHAEKKVVGAPVLGEDGSQGRQHAGLVLKRRRWHTVVAKRTEFETFVTMVWELSSTSFIHFRSSKPITAALKANISECVVGKHRQSPVVANLDVPSLTYRIGLRGVVHRCLKAEHSDFLELRRHGTASQRSAF